MWFEEISFRGFLRKLESVGRTAAVETETEMGTGTETETAAETDQKQ